MTNRNSSIGSLLSFDRISLSKEMIKSLIKAILLGRIGETCDMVNVFKFLVSDMASYKLEKYYL